MTTTQTTSPKTSASAVTLRPYREDDHDIRRVIEIHNANERDSPASEENFRYFESIWDHQKFFRTRLMAEDASGRVVAYGQLHHMMHQFHPQKYWLHIGVEPAHHRQGIGTTLYERLLDEARRRDAVLLRAEAQESKTHVIDFLTHRGFQEVQRSWESRLAVPSFDFAKFAGAAERVADQGIVITTLKDELARDPEALKAVYALDQEATEDEPSIDPITLLGFDHFVKFVLEAPNVLLEANFLAKDGDAYAGLSFLYKDLSLPHVLQQGFTATGRAYRGRGIAMALKLEGVRWAREHGYTEIRTSNNSRNRPMLRINEAMGFAKEPVYITFQKDL